MSRCDCERSAHCEGAAALFPGLAVNEGPSYAVKPGNEGN